MHVGLYKVHGEHGMCTLPKVCGEVAYTDKEIKASKSMSELAVSQDRAAHPVSQDRGIQSVRTGHQQEKDDENHNSVRSCL